MASSLLEEFDQLIDFAPASKEYAGVILIDRSPQCLP